MTALAAAERAAPVFRPGRVLQSLRTAEPGFFGCAVALLFAATPLAFAAGIEARTFLGINVWIKPLKFELALIVYLLTLALFARWLPTGTTGRRWYRAYRLAVIAAIVAEMVWIGGAAMLGTASHFNRTPTGIVIYSAMGLGAILLTTPTAVYAWLIARNPATGLAPALKSSVVIGLGLVLPLTLATAGTMSSLATHAVGGAGTDAGGLPLMGWARDGGDLRVAHFFATHALHFIPAFGLVSAAFFGSANRLPVRIFATIYAGFVIWVFAEALAGRPFLPWIG
ncbi:hypothetical protein [Kumtagia ephedrae]|uniref:hypothetical protein n=1 Tax=Kumtagia ephedrae TaxID=2116701 RepID=UPI001057314C|nr:hypothetical protein [Mesorhizobium ephedrae]